MTFTLLSWNIRQGGGARLPRQMEVLAALHPDVVALQEVRHGGTARTADALRAIGYAHVATSFDALQDEALAAGPRRNGVLIASRWTFRPHGPETFHVPWKEKALSATLNAPFGPLEVTVVYTPPGASNGWTKIETLEGVFRRLATPSAKPRILCGDFNTPKGERRDGAVETWGEGDARWDAAEAAVLRGLAVHDLPDAFQALHGHGAQAFSCLVRGVPRRYDHVFASARLRPRAFVYLHEHRETGLSDHAPAWVTFDDGAEI